MIGGFPTTHVTTYTGIFDHGVVCTGFAIDIRFTVSVPALTAQKFVEQERMMLIDHLHQAFNNRSISFSILVDASEKEEVPAHMRMNSKEKFERIAEQYPLVKELRDKLKLEIDY